jgi:hypothetical protein
MLYKVSCGNTGLNKLRLHHNGCCAVLAHITYTQESNAHQICKHYCDSASASNEASMNMARKFHLPRQPSIHHLQQCTATLPTSRCNHAGCVSLTVLLKDPHTWDANMRHVPVATSPDTQPRACKHSHQSNINQRRTTVPTMNLTSTRLCISHVTAFTIYSFRQTRVAKSTFPHISCDQPA